MDHESSRVHSARMLHNLLHWAETTSSSEESWRFGGLGEFQRNVVYFVCRWHVFRKSSFQKQDCMMLMQMTDLFGSVLRILLYWIFRPLDYPPFIHTV